MSGSVSRLSDRQAVARAPFDRRHCHRWHVSRDFSWRKPPHSALRDVKSQLHARELTILRSSVDTDRTQPITLIDVWSAQLCSASHEGSAAQEIKLDDVASPEVSDTDTADEDEPADEPADPSHRAATSAVLRTWEGAARSMQVRSMAEPIQLALRGQTAREGRVSIESYHTLSACTAVLHALSDAERTLTLVAPRHWPEPSSSELTDAIVSRCMLGFVGARRFDSLKRLVQMLGTADDGTCDALLSIGAWCSEIDEHGSGSEEEIEESSSGAPVLLVPVRIAIQQQTEQSARR